MNTSPTKDLVQHLCGVQPPPPKKAKHYTEPCSEHSLKQEMRKNYRNPWKVNGAIHHSFHLDRLPIGDLDNWQVSRIHMAERSY